jgi:type IV pilus biogenesis protein CpaD/CtpE
MQDSSCSERIVAVLRRQLICLAASALACCDRTDPYLREGVWQPNGANDENLRVMVASPSDLVRGVASLDGDGQQAAAALDRYRNDKPRLLPESSVAKIVPVSGGSGTQGGQ